MNKIEYHIAQLIVKKKLTSLTEKEQQILKEWQQRTPENTKLYTTVFSEKRQENRALLLSKIDKETAYEKVQKSIKNQKHFVRLQRWLVSAVAVFIVGLLGILIKKLYVSEVYAPKQVAISNIQPGATKATLVLSNGKTLQLEQLTQDSLILQEGVNIQHDEKKLDYSKQKNTSTSTARYNTVRVPAGGEYQLVLADGTKVWLNSESTIKYPVQFIAGKRDVWVSGEVCFDVAHDKHKPFIVNVNNTKIEVLGTVFNVEAYPEQSAVTTTLARGSVRLKNEHKQVELVPNQQAIVNSNSIEVKNVDVYEFLAWRDGYFYFKEANLSTIMDKLGRWYDVKIFYKQANLQDKRFSVEMKRYENIQKMLDILAKTNKVKFEIKGNVITVYN